MGITSINPATGQVLRTFEPLSDSQIEAKLRLAAETFPKFRKLAFADRARMMTRAADILESEKEALGRLMTSEMGKTFRSAVDEAVKCAWGCRYYAENAERFLADEVVETSAKRSYIRYQPLGVVLAVMPWNFPFWQVFRFIAPGLMAGNAGLLKHASNVPQCALKVEEIMRRAGFPEGAFQTLLIGAQQVEAILNDPRVAAATLTGSEGAGVQVGVSAARRIKKVVLELGGSDPFIVMPSANLDEAIETAVKARIINNGQSCIAAKRFIVAESVAGKFESVFVSKMKALKVGDPMEPATDVGPLSTAEAVASLHADVQKTIEAGARSLPPRPRRMPGRIERVPRTEIECLGPARLLGLDQRHRRVVRGGRRDAEQADRSAADHGDVVARIQAAGAVRRVVGDREGFDQSTGRVRELVRKDVQPFRTRAEVLRVGTADREAEMIASTRAHHALAHHPIARRHPGHGRAHVDDLT